MYDDRNDNWVYALSLAVMVVTALEIFVGISAMYPAFVTLLLFLCGFALLVTIPDAFEHLADDDER